MSIDTSSAFDVEVPLDYFGLTGREEKLDAAASSTQLSVFAERYYALPSTRWVPFWAIADGINCVDVDDLSDMLENCNPFELRFDAGT